MQSGWIQTLRAREEPNEILLKLVENFSESNSNDSPDNSAVSLLANMLKNSQVHLTKNPGVIMAILTALIINSGVPSYITHNNNDLIFLSSTNPITPSHWPALSIQDQPRLYIAKHSNQKIIETPTEYSIPGEIREKLKEKLMKANPELKDADVSQVLSKAYILEVLDSILDPISLNKQKIEPLGVKAYTAGIVESSRSVSERIKIIKSTHKPLDVKDITTLKEFHASSMEPVSSYIIYKHDHTSKQVNLASTFSYGMFNFNSPELFPWFLLGSLWNYQSILLQEIFFSWSHKGMMVDSILLTSKQHSHATNGKYI